MFGEQKSMLFEQYSPSNGGEFRPEEKPLCTRDCVVVSLTGDFLEVLFSRLRRRNVNWLKTNLDAK